MQSEKTELSPQRPRRVIRAALAVLMIALLLPAVAQAEKRIALIIGNGGYTSIGGLDNPVRDADLMATTLGELGFDVTIVRNADAGSMKRAIARFGKKLREAGTETTGLFYYAGHGVQSFGSNYLLPVDTALSDAADLPLVAVEAETVLRQMFSARNRTNIVVLDACRNNPFERVASFTDDGLAEMKAPTGTFLSYATAPGAVAMDGEGANSPFTTALAAAMTEPGLPIEQVFKRVRVAVLEKTDGAQTPWDTSSLTTNFVFRPKAEAPGADTRFWQNVKAGGNADQIALFLTVYPESKHAEEARALLEELTSAKAPVAKAPETKPPVATLPAESDEAAFAAAREAGTAAAYRAYLSTHPDGVFADLARLEIAALDTGTSTDPVGEGVTPKPPETVAVAPSPVTEEPTGVTFRGPLRGLGDPIDGRSLAELIAMTPLYTPIDGLPDEVWKDKTCASCHQWDRESLCTQSKTYVTRAVEGVERISHPFGTGFKSALADWARAGCPDG